MKIYPTFITVVFVTGCIALAVPAFAQPKKRKGKDADTVVVKKQEPWEIETLIAPISIGKQLYTDKINRTVANIDLRDGKADNIFTYGTEAATKKFTEAFKKVPKLIILIENLQLEQNETVKYHKSLQEDLQSIQTMSWDNLPDDYFNKDLDNLRGLIIAQYKQGVLPFAKDNQSIFTLNHIELLERNKINLAGAEEAKALLYKGLAKVNPTEIIARLPRVKDQPYVDGIISDIAQVSPEKLLEYAKDEGPVGALIKRNPDQLVQSIVRIAAVSKNPEKLIPFLGPISRNEKSISAAEQITRNEQQYLQALVDMIVNDEKLFRNMVNEELKKALSTYAQKINNETLADQARFASINNLRDIDYYILMVAGKDLFSSNTFLNGLFPSFINALGKKSGAQLFQQVHNYRFRTFTRLCAENGQLDQFFKTMTVPERDQLLTDIMNNLESGPIDNISEATEAASILQYIDEEDLVYQLLGTVETHYKRIKSQQNAGSGQKGILTYGMLYILFEQKISKDRNTLFDSIGLTKIPYEKFLNSNNEIIEQVYFYPGPQSKSNYTAFVNELRSNSAWKIEDAEHWIKAVSQSGAAKTVIYANKISANPNSTVNTVDALETYLKKNSYKPVVVYNFSPVNTLSEVVAKVQPGLNVVMGAYSFGDDNLIKTLSKVPAAHILSSRKYVNPAVEIKVFMELNKQLAYGRSLNWNDMWRDLTSYYTDIDPTQKSVFNNFIQPDKNYGELFVKLYKKYLN